VAEILLEVLVLTEWSGKDHFHTTGPRGGGMAVSERLGSHGTVIAGVIAIGSDFVEGGDGRMYALFVWEQADCGRV